MKGRIGAAAAFVPKEEIAFTVRYEKLTNGIAILSFGIDVIGK